MHDLHPMHAGENGHARAPTLFELGARLELATSAIAGRVVELIERLRAQTAPGTPESPLLEQFRRALLLTRSAYAAANAAANGQGTAPHPFDRLAEALAFSPFEIDLLFLAALPEQHEAFAAVLAGLHPRGEPRASI